MINVLTGDNIWVNKWQDRKLAFDTFCSKRNIWRQNNGFINGIKFYIQKEKIQ